MKISLNSNEIISLSTDIVALGVFEEQVTELPAFQAIDRALSGALAEIVSREAFSGKADQKLQVHTLGQLPFAQLLLVGLGSRASFQLTDTRRYGALALLAAQTSRCGALALALPPLDLSAQSKALQLLVEGALLGDYRFDNYKTNNKKDKKKIESLTLVAETLPESSSLAIARARIVAEAICLARDLVNEPAAALTPVQLALRSQALAERVGLECKVLGPKDCERLKMKLLLAVAQGSVEEPRFIHLKYRPKGRSKPPMRIVLVGKGITFDSGGLSLKPPASMLDMKTDMAGAAAVLAVMQALPALGLKLEVHGLIPAAENMPSGSAVRLGDIITGAGGKSVEIVNTDAEGRLALADALTYALKQEPDEVFDVATLTGACVVALGPHMAGVMGNDLALIERFLAAARLAGEEVWHLPLPERLNDQLKSPLADLKNAGDRWGGALTAGLFLKEFAGKVPWVHLDIAGPASTDKDWAHIRKGGTGFGVAALLEYLLSRTSQS